MPHQYWCRLHHFTETVDSSKGLFLGTNSKDGSSVHCHVKTMSDQEEGYMYITKEHADGSNIVLFPCGN